MEIQVSENADLKCDCQHEKISTQKTSKKKIKLPEVDSKPFDNRQRELDNENICGKRRDQATSTLSANANHANPHAEIRDFDTPSGPSDISRVKETPCLELTLKRMRGVEDDRSAANEDCNVLRHSNFSAFSKYDFNLKALNFGFLANYNEPKTFIFFSLSFFLFFFGT